MWRNYAKDAKERKCKILHFQLQHVGRHLYAWFEIDLDVLVMVHLYFVRFLLLYYCIIVKVLCSMLTFASYLHLVFNVQYGTSGLLYQMEYDVTFEPVGVKKNLIC